ncbi:hypothetical protein JCGZ_25286 [Jatropha curcas]|uniref:Uncharacterized protein n=1 Tax=Jatropha curcas TaxID=180498 RepID=A0A067JZ45_JATCU|nr:hypothetical protein JCGZ_25286 [Jatropha curcas]
MRSRAKKQRCVFDEVLASWQQAWSDPQYMRRQKNMSRNRLSETGGEGAGSSRPNCGSISTTEITEKLALKLRCPTPMESSRSWISMQSLLDIYPSSRASRKIMRTIKLHQDKNGYTWDAVPQEKHFVWEEAITTMLKVAWEKLCTLLYANFTYRMRKSSKK